MVEASFVKRGVAAIVMCLALAFGPADRSAADEVYYTVQVETLSFAPAARVVLKNLAASGYDAYVAPFETSSGKVLYKIRFGTFATRQEADRAAEAFRQKERRDCFVVESSKPLPRDDRQTLPQQKTKTAQPAAERRPAQPAGIHRPVRRVLVASDVLDDALRSGKSYYTVQVAAKSDRAVAESFAARLQQLGYPAFIQQYGTSDGTVLYKIRIGRYEARARAEKVGRYYRDRERGEYLVVLSRLPAALETAATQPPETPHPIAPEPEMPEAQRPADAAERGDNPVVGAAPSAPSGSFYTVQVSVKESRASADRLMAKLRRKGFAPFVSTYETAAGKTLYKVRMGAYEKRTRAEELGRKYKRQGGRDYLVVLSSAAATPAAPVPAAEPAFEISAPPQVRQPEAREPSAPQRKTAPVEPDRDVQRDITAEKSLVEKNLPASKPKGWPEKITKIFAYTGFEDELNLTNAYDNIPKELREKIEYVSVFPVMFLAAADDEDGLAMEIEGSRRMVRLAGIRFPQAQRELVTAWIKENLTAEPLRLKYNPEEDGAETLTGRLYYKGGTYINFELLQRGLALVDDATVLGSQKKAFHAALGRARRLKAGIWSGR